VIYVCACVCVCLYGMVQDMYDPTDPTFNVPQTFSKENEPGTHYEWVCVCVCVCVCLCVCVVCVCD